MIYDFKLLFYFPTNEKYKKFTPVELRKLDMSSLVKSINKLGAKPLSKPMLVNCQLNPQEQTSVKF